MIKERKSRAFNPRYESPGQLALEGFESPFSKTLNPRNRWVVLGNLIPWDEICSQFRRGLGNPGAGRKPLNPRIVIGSLIIKYMLNLDDRETVLQISENMYMQYFLGYSSFTDEEPFDASLFVDFRKMLGLDTINAINEKIVKLKTRIEEQAGRGVGEKPASGKATESPSEGNIREGENSHESGAVFGATARGQDNVVARTDLNRIDEQAVAECREKPSSSRSDLQTPEIPGEIKVQEEVSHKGRIIFDATACPQDIAYPTDLNLLSDAREKAEELIDRIYDKELHGDKPRTYRREARKCYLQTAQKKNKTKKSMRKAVGKQLRYLKRDIGILHHLSDSYERLPFDRHQRKYFYVIQTVYEQQKEMYDNRVHTVPYRIVSIHQPHVRPIVRGKDRAKVEFGSKIHVSIIDGISFVDELSWEAFNEGSRLQAYVEHFRRRFGCYPREVLADMIYCTRENRAWLKSKGILLRAKPLGRPSAVSIHVSPGERNPIEGKFGQGKTAYGLNRIRARLRETSESWIAGIFLVLNLVKLAGAVLPCLLLKLLQNLTAICRKIISMVRREYRTPFRYREACMAAQVKRDSGASQAVGKTVGVSIHVSPGERNPMEGKFGQGKTAYGLNHIRARLREISESWVSGIFLCA